MVSGEVTPASMNAPSVQSHGTIGVAHQIPRNTLALLMVAQVAVILPYLQQLSIWIIAVGLFCGLWRTNVYLGRWDYPKRWLKAVLVIACVGGVAISGVGAFSLEAMASLLVSMFALKLIEMKSRRDAYVVIFLGYFAIAIQFLFEQQLLLAVYQLVAFVLVTAAMVSLNQLQVAARPLPSLRLASLLVLQAVPLTLVMFLLFPRMAPLWTVPLPGSSMTGLSDVVKPGDIANLTQSDELAFRVVVEGQMPPPSQRYWRGLVFSDFEDGGWKARNRRPARDYPMPSSTDLHYEVLLEPTMQTWLYALDNSTSEHSNVYLTQDGRLESEDPIMSVFRYRAVQHRPERRAEPLTEAVRARETAIDSEANPRLQALGPALLAEHGSPMAMTRAILMHIREVPFHYTLSPPQYPGQDAFDGFWFDGRAGFCEHYASAYVYLMRSAGIPARLVGGYLGGEVNQVSGHLIVRQYDAHAWAEFYDETLGWFRVDPTAAVAPERIEQGLTAALSSSDLASLPLLSSARIGDWDLASDVLRWMDSIEHRWNLWVVGFDSNAQYRSAWSHCLVSSLRRRVGMAMLIGGGMGQHGRGSAMVHRSGAGGRCVNRHPVERRCSPRFSDRAGRARDISTPAGGVSIGDLCRRVASQVGLTEAQVGGCDRRTRIRFCTIRASRGVVPGA